MKKLFIAILGVAAFAACSQDMTLETPKGAAIAFDNAFVENSTRAAEDLTATNLENFGVYATVAKGGEMALILENKEVVKQGSDYVYSPVQYWVNNAAYSFTAFAPKQNAQWSYAAAENKDAYNGVISFNNAAALGEQDLLFASTDRETQEITAAPAAVGFTFSHLLSKVAFKFTNIFTDENISLNVYGVQINNAAAEGTLQVVDGATQSWTGTGNYVRAFGAAEASEDAALANAASLTTEHFYLIPVEREYNITFNVGLYQAGVLLNTYEHEINVNLDLEKGKSYILNASLAAENVNPDNQLYPIEFKVADVEDWVETTVEAEATTVATADALAAAVAAGGDVRLTADITLTASELNVAADKEVNVELNGKTLTVNSLDPIKNNGKMTISNGKVEAAYGENTRRCIYNYGEMVIDGVEFVQTYDQKGAAINNEGKLTINNATVNAVYYSVWCSGADSETVINGGTFTTTNNVELRDTWAYAVLAQNGAKLTINGGAFTGNHGVIAAYGANSLVTVNGGAFNCTATYTGNSDWVFYTEGGATIKYDESECTITSANPSGNFHSSQVGTNIIAF